MLKRKAYLLIVCFAVLCVSGAPAGAGLFGFARITSNTSDPVEAQLCVDVTSYGTNQVLFRFYNNPVKFSEFYTTSPISSSICDVYFDDGALLGIASIINSNGVAFSQFATPKNLCGGQNLSPPFETTSGFSADSDSPVQPNGVNPGEYVGIVFNLEPNKDFDDVISAINLGFSNPWLEDSLRIGIHVQAIGISGNSDSFIMTPVPGAVILGMLGLSVAGWKLRKLA